MLFDIMNQLKFSMVTFKARVHFVLFQFIHVEAPFLRQFNHNTASGPFSVHFCCGFIQGFILLLFRFSSISSLPFALLQFVSVEAYSVHCETLNGIYPVSVHSNEEISCYAFTQ